MTAWSEEVDRFDGVDAARVGWRRRVLEEGQLDLRDAGIAAHPVPTQRQQRIGRVRKGAAAASLRSSGVVGSKAPGTTNAGISETTSSLNVGDVGSTGHSGRRGDLRPAGNERGPVGCCGAGQSGAFEFTLDLVAAL